MGFHHHSFSLFTSTLWELQRSMVSWYGQWCWTFPTWRWRCALEIHFTFLCWFFFFIAARLSGPVRTIFLLKRECSIVQQVTTVTTGTGTLFAYVNVNLPSQISSMSKASPSMLYVGFMRTSQDCVFASLNVGEIYSCKWPHKDTTPWGTFSKKR